MSCTSCPSLNISTAAIVPCEIASVHARVGPCPHQNQGVRSSMTTLVPGWLKALMFEMSSLACSYSCPPSIKTMSKEASGFCVRYLGTVHAESPSTSSCRPGYCASTNSLAVPTTSWQPISKETTCTSALALRKAKLENPALNPISPTSRAFDCLTRRRR